MRYRTLLCLPAVLVLTGTSLQAHVIERVSVSAEGGNPDGVCRQPAVTEDGRLVAFASSATNLIEGGWTESSNIYLRDRLIGETWVISVTPAGGAADGGSSYPALSADGRYVAFVSDATDLVPHDTNGSADVFVHDRTTGETHLVSVASGGTQTDNGSSLPSISANGHFVAFESYASNLVPGDTDQMQDVFVHDSVSGETLCVSVGLDGLPTGGGHPSISADGQFIAFQSYASNIVPDDTNNASDIFIYDLATGVISRVSLSSVGEEANGACLQPSISADGRWVVFDSTATNLCSDDINRVNDVFVHDRESGTTERVSIDSQGRQGLDESRSGTISDDGRFVVFLSKATNLFPEESYHERFNAILRDRRAGKTRLVNHNGHGQAGDQPCDDAVIASGGSLVVFSSRASDLVPDDDGGFRDVFASDTCPGATSQNYGDGWPGTNGVPALAVADDPLPCHLVTLAVENSVGSPTIAVLLYGLNRADRQTSLGGTLLVEPNAAWPLAFPGTGLVWPVTIPCGDLCNTYLYLQAVELARIMHEVA